MALKVELKPHERVIIGSCVVTNTDQRARLLIDGDNIPILREKDILTPETADTPAKLVYLAVQLMYISPDPQVNHGTYFNLVRDIVTAAPSTWPIIELETRGSSTIGTFSVATLRGFKRRTARSPALVPSAAADFRSEKNTAEE